MVQLMCTPPGPHGRKLYCKGLFCPPRRPELAKRRGLGFEEHCPMPISPETAGVILCILYTTIKVSLCLRTA